MLNYRNNRYNQSDVQRNSRTDLVSAVVKPFVIVPSMISSNSLIMSVCQLTSLSDSIILLLTFLLLPMNMSSYFMLKVLIIMFTFDTMYEEHESRQFLKWLAISLYGWFKPAIMKFIIRSLIISTNWKVFMISGSRHDLVLGCNSNNLRQHTRHVLNNSSNFLS